MYHNYHRMLIEMELDRSDELLEDERRLSNVKESKLLKTKYSTHKNRKKRIFVICHDHQDKTQRLM
jgi:hypothetical protein